MEQISDVYTVGITDNDITHKAHNRPLKWYLTVGIAAIGWSSSIKDVSSSLTQPTNI